MRRPIFTRCAPCKLVAGRGRTTVRTVTTNESRWKIWLSAARPRTLPAAVAPVMVGSALAFEAGAFDGLAAGICLAFALLVQIGTNFANDYFDFIKGADTAARVGPRRAVAAGLVAPAAMKRAMTLTFALAFAVGSSLIAWGGWWLVVIGAASILSGLAYTGGPRPLGYLGLGDAFVFVFFGLVAVCATFYVQTGHVTADAVAAAAAIGALAANVLLVNNYRDAETDAAAGKRTLVVRLGKRFARAQFAAAHLVAGAVAAALAWRGLYHPVAGAIAAVIFVIAGHTQLRALQAARTPGELVRLLGRCSVYLAVYAVGLSLLVVTG